jgi:fumarate hydratase class II
VPRALARLAAETGLAWREAADHFEAQGARDAAVAASGALRGAAISLAKIAGDVRLLASGPRCGLAELRLPAVQPGSSIMPGKVNPVIPEAVIQVCAQVLGNDHAVALGGLGGQLELNAMIPLIARNVLESIRLLASASRVFAQRAIHGLTADRARAQDLLERSSALVTALAPRIGYDRAAEIARLAAESGRSVREICLEQRVLPEEELARLLDARAMTGR